MAEGELVRFETDNGIGIITVDNPPVNALSPGVPQGIVAALDKGNADPSVKAMVLIGAGRSFIAGADIRQFGKGPAAPPPTRRHYDVMDQSAKPVVAAIHGYALGGGLETALACHYRVAVPSAKVGLPEVLIGILPGAGGTQRLPRLIGPKAALEMITSGRHVPAEEAHKLGIVDEIAPEGELKEAAIAFARKIADQRPLPVIRERNEKLGRRHARAVRRHAQIDRPARPQPARALCLHRGGRGGVQAPVRRGLCARTQIVRRAGRLGGGEGPALRLFRRARGRENPVHPGRHQIAPDRSPGGRRRRHDGRRHRDELCRQRLRREDHRRDQGSARPRHGADQGQLRDQRQTRQPGAGRDTSAASPASTRSPASTISPIATW